MSKKIIVIGGVALGPQMRLAAACGSDPTAEITLFVKTPLFLRRLRLP